MSHTGILIFFVFSVVFSSFLTQGVRHYALRRHILDIPNDRSSHIVPTPRGGGLAFVGVFLVGISLLFGLGILELRVFLALLGGGGLIAGVGWLDDRRGLTALVRLCFHFLAAIWAVSWLGGVPSLSLGFTELDLSWWGSGVAVIGVVWMINLYNFMDGIDGIAGTEAVTISGAAVIFLWAQNSDVAAVCLLILAAVFGFLIWNWPPAKIFMGDVGSGFLGFVFAVLAIWSENSGAVPLLIWLLLLGVFIIDATVTLIKRMAGGEKLYEAHRSHVYQLAVQAGYSHKQVTLTVLLINIMLGIVAAVALYYYDYLLLITLVVLAVLIVAHLLLGQVFNTLIARMNVNANNMVVEQFKEEAAATRDMADKD
jgi:Fuc2NAc and GlcNAc transferase